MLVTIKYLLLKYIFNSSGSYSMFILFEIKTAFKTFSKYDNSTEWRNIYVK